jgi:endonuclease/exonuclease/phosphatase (EEP) superfamily protein YafD
MRPWRNATQVHHLVEWVDALAKQEVALVGGDFNAPEWTPSIAAARRAWRDPFRELHRRAEAATFVRPLLRARLDYIFLRDAGRGWYPVEARLVGAPGSARHSDHRAVLVRFETDRPRRWPARGPEALGGTRVGEASGPGGGAASGARRGWRPSRAAPRAG